MFHIVLSLLSTFLINNNFSSHFIVSSRKTTLEQHPTKTSNIAKGTTPAFFIFANYCVFDLDTATLLPSSITHCHRSRSLSLPQVTRTRLLWPPNAYWRLRWLQPAPPTSFWVITCASINQWGVTQKRKQTAALTSIWNVYGCCSTQESLLTLIESYGYTAEVFYDRWTDSKQWECSGDCTSCEA